jgi:hypothetical protein
MAFRRPCRGNHYTSCCEQRDKEQKGIIENVKPIMDNLKRHNFFIGENIYIETLKLSGEL